MRTGSCSVMAACWAASRPHVSGPSAGSARAPIVAWVTVERSPPGAEVRPVETLAVGQRFRGVGHVETEARLGRLGGDDEEPAGGRVAEWIRFAATHLVLGEREAAQHDVGGERR